MEVVSVLRFWLAHWIRYMDFLPQASIPLCILDPVLFLVDPNDPDQWSIFSNIFLFANDIQNDFEKWDQSDPSLLQKTLNSMGRAHGIWNYNQ